MSKLLIIETSVRGAHSVSRNMGEHFVKVWQLAHPGGEVIHRDLTKTPLDFVTTPWLEAYFTPPPQQSEAMKAALALSNELVEELISADHIAIVTPVYNYNVPASLKAWIDYIVRKGITLGMDGRGLLTGKSATLLLASGGIYTEGSPIKERDIATQYLRLLLNVMGIEDIKIVAGGGAKAVDLGEETMASFIHHLHPEIEMAVNRN